MKEKFEVSSISGRNVEESKHEDITPEESADLLIWLIKEGHSKDAIKLITEGAYLNVLIPTDEGMTSPLLSAVEQLNPEVTKALLEHGANPNLEPNNGISLIEELLKVIGLIAMKSYDGTAEKHPLKLFGKSLPIQVKQTLNAKLIDRAHKILDLLLCYDINPHFKWSKSFEEATKTLMDAEKLRRQSSAFNKSISEQFDITLRLKHGLNPGAKKILLSGLMKGSYWMLHGRKHKSSAGHIPSLVASISAVPREVIRTAAEINLEKTKRLLSYRDKVAQSIPSFPIVLIDLITHYILSVSNFTNEVAIHREKNNKTIKFWVQPTDEKQEIEQERKIMVQHHKYAVVTERLFDLIGKNGHQIVLDYLLAIPEESLNRNIK